MDALKLQVWAEAFVGEVAKVVAHCADVLQTPASFRRLTPSDFPLLRGVAVQELDALVAGMAGAAGQGGHIAPEAIEDIYPCTPLQEGLLMETMLDRTANVEQLTLRLKGPLDPARWRAAWTAMARRHGILRTRLVPRAGASGSARQDGDATFLQVLLRGDAPAAEPEWVEADWDLGSQAGLLADHLERDRRRGFVCGDGMVRFATFCLQPCKGPAQHIFVWSEHHALTDGWSGPLVLQDALQLYDAAGALETLGPSPPPFRSYVECTMRRDVAELQSFWRAQLEGWSGWQSLAPLGEPCPAREAADAPSGFVQLSRTPSVKLEDLARLGQRFEVTLAAVIHAAWALMLAHATSSTDVVFGIVMSGRDVPVPDVEQMVGMLICTLPMRMRMAKDMSLEELLQSAHGALLAAAAHQHCNFAEVRQWCGLRGTPSDLFQSLIVFENFPGGPSRVGAALQVAPVASESIPVTYVCIYIYIYICIYIYIYIYIYITL